MRSCSVFLPSFKRGYSWKNKQPWGVFLWSQPAFRKLEGTRKSFGSSILMASSWFSLNFFPPTCFDYFVCLICPFSAFWVWGPKQGDRCLRSCSDHSRFCQIWLWKISPICSSSYHLLRFQSDALDFLRTWKESFSLENFVKWFVEMFCYFRWGTHRVPTILSTYLYSKKVRSQRIATTRGYLIPSDLTG